MTKDLIEAARKVSITRQHLQDALNYILHCGANATMKGLPHPQQWIVDNLRAALAAHDSAQEVVSNGRGDACADDADKNASILPLAAESHAPAVSDSGDRGVAPALAAAVLEADVLPCPFCGGPANADGGAVDCPNTKCAGNFVACTVAEWNTRPSLTPASEEEIEKALIKAHEWGHDENPCIAFDQGFRCGYHFSTEMQSG